LRDAAEVRTAYAEILANAEAYLNAFRLVVDLNHHTATAEQ